jgi:hypothetical protein
MQDYAGYLGGEPLVWEPAAIERLRAHLDARFGAGAPRAAAERDIRGAAERATHLNGLPSVTDNTLRALLPRLPGEDMNGVPG